MDLGRGKHIIPIHSLILTLKYIQRTEHQWLVSVILAAWEAEMSGSRAAIRKKSLQDLISVEKSWAWW
jgi:hypothetical protein